MRDGIILAKITTKPRFENGNFRFFREIIPKAVMMKRIPTWKHHEENGGMRKCLAKEAWWHGEIWACYVIAHKTYWNLSEAARERANVSTAVWMLLSWPFSIALKKVESSTYFHNLKPGKSRSLIKIMESHGHHATLKNSLDLVSLAAYGNSESKWSKGKRPQEC